MQSHTAKLLVSQNPKNFSLAQMNLSSSVEDDVVSQQTSCSYEMQDERVVDIFKPNFMVYLSKSHNIVTAPIIPKVPQSIFHPQSVQFQPQTTTNIAFPKPSLSPCLVPMFDSRLLKPKPVQLESFQTMSEPEPAAKKIDTETGHKKNSY